MAKTVLVTNEAGRRLPPGARTAMEAAARGALRAAGFTGDPELVRVDLTIVTDEQLRALSREYLGADHYTDVMSFSQLEGESLAGAGPRSGGDILLLGDVVVSLERAREQASEAGHAPAVEMALLVAHGVLHLLGYGDESDDEAGRMRQLERQALAFAGLALGAVAGGGR